MTLLAFHGDESVKAKYLNRVLAHAAADEIIHGKYWERGKGCAVGCTIHSGEHGNYETELGIPRMLGRFFLWRARRRHAAHKVWLRQGRVVYTAPQHDSRDWSSNYMNSVKKGQR